MPFKNLQTDLGLEFMVLFESIGMFSNDPSPLHTGATLGGPEGAQLSVYHNIGQDKIMETLRE